MPQMIEPKLSGRLGNFMFEVATAYAYSLRHAIDYNVSPIGGGQPNEVMERYLSKFQNIKTGNQIQQPYFHYEENGRHEYNEIPKHKNILIDGYFQSQRYFNEYRKEILELFGFDYWLNKGVVSIHVRRGDYVQFFNSFPPVDRRYIDPAIRIMERNGFKKFLVFGDDYEWNKANINSSIFPESYFEYSTGLSEFEDMQLMSCCEHNIIANSSFSWWGAWLNQNPNKLVVTPSKDNWFGKRVKLNTKDIIPDGWVQVNF